MMMSVQKYGKLAPHYNTGRDLETNPSISL